MAFICRKCGLGFPKNQGLQRHLERKKPCDPIIMDDKDDKDVKNQCRFCRRQFSRLDSLGRHLKICKIANTDEGMEKLMDHTIQRQLAAQNARIDHLTSILERQLNIAEQQPITIVNNVPVNVTNNTNNTNNTNVTINITPWDDADCIKVTREQLEKSFLENKSLQEYVGLNYDGKTDSDKAPTYVGEFLVDQTIRSHGDPAARNVYLSPNRADQGLVFQRDGNWEIRPLTALLSSIYEKIMNRDVKSLINEGLKNPEQKFESDKEDALALLIMMYNQFDPETYVKMVKGPLSAHLENNRAGLKRLGKI